MSKYLKEFLNLEEELNAEGKTLIVGIRSEVDEETGLACEDTPDMYFDGYAEVWDVTVLVLKDGEIVDEYTDTADVESMDYFYNGEMPEA